MFNHFRKELDWGGRKLVLETGKIARQADGAVLVSYGDTIVLCTAVGAKSAKPGQDFFPLTVNYQEKAFAAGKIPGGFFKREGRPSEKETLVSRLIDRPIRPLFPQGFRNEVQVVATVLSHDLENDPDIVALVGCSAALTLSGIPFFGPVAAARVGFIDGAYVLNPTAEQMKGFKLDLVVAGTTEGVLMVESEARELSEDVMLGAVEFGHQHFQPVIAAIVELAEHAAKEPWALSEVAPEMTALANRIDELARAPLAAAYQERVKQVRQDAVSAAKKAATATLAEEGLEADKAKGLFKELEADVVRNAILDTGTRIDGRDTKTVRPIIAEVGILPRAHGSALFTRGETQALCVATLGTGQDEQIVDALEGESRQHFMLHYNFPPYSVGEAGRMGSPGRREIGHGKLAWRALHPLLPEKSNFPYTLRVVSEITESNGSSSMATVCGTSLALMDAGVPLLRPVAGIAMGLIKEDRGFAVLSDILGDEDHLGDMDFKVAGTSAGVTSLQMDIKITSITPEIMRIALDQARDGRLHILGEMDKALTGARSDVAATAPRITVIHVPKEKIREVIGTGQDEQVIDALEGERREHFMLHYNFPPYSVGEAGRMGSPGRREIGHGKLAYRAVRPVLPGKDVFPYTMRVVSEITESNGSSSMATVCGTSLALMDAGVPLTRPVAGIAMGLIKEDRGFAVLSDILGDEDHLGDMDFKVAGSEQGVTSLQMDIKITSITADIMKVALEQARDGRLHILGEMARAIQGARSDVAATAPRITIITVPKEKIREVIGTGGKVIRDIVEQSGAKVDIEDDGTIKIAATTETASQKAIDMIRGIVAEPEVGQIYNGKVVKTADFGAFVNFLGAKDGLVHISELQQGRVNKTTDVVNQGDAVKVKVLGFDDRGKVKLSMRVVDQATGADITEQVGSKGARDGGRENGGREGGRRERSEPDAAE